MGRVVAAGGLGERLGYSGIKVRLPLYIVERQRVFLQLYIEVQCANPVLREAACAEPLQRRSLSEVAPGRPSAQTLWCNDDSTSWSFKGRTQGVRSCRWQS